MSKDFSLGKSVFGESTEPNRATPSPPRPRTRKGTETLDDLLGDLDRGEPRDLGQGRIPVKTW